MATLHYPGVPGTVIYGGRPAAAPGVDLTSLTLANESASPQAPGFVTRIFGLPLREGDVPAGSWPAFFLGDGTPVPASLGKFPARWPDGSMRHVSVMLRVPASVPGSGSIAVTVKSGGIAPASSALTPASLTAASDLQVSANALRNWTAGVWVSSVNKGIADGDLWEFMDGPAGKVWRVYEAFRQAGADHAQAGVWHYVQALQNAAGGLYGLRYLGKFANGWHDVAAPAINTLAADGVAVKNGATTVRAVAPKAAARAFTWSSGLSVASDAGLVSGMAVRLSTTGTLPAGLSNSTAYFVRLTGGGAFTLHGSVTDVDYNASPVAVTTAGTGTHTLTPAVQLEFYAAGPYTAGPTSDYDFVQAGGTGAECTVAVSVDRAYRKASRLFGPIRTDISPAPATSADYYMDTWDMYPGQNGTGEREDIGYFAGWCTNHFINGAGLRRVRTTAMQYAARSWSLRRAATKAPMNLTPDAYAGLGAGTPTYSFYPSNDNAHSGVNAPLDKGRMRGTHDWSHQPHICAYAYIVTGEPQFLDATHDMGVAALASAQNKTVTVSGTSYSNIVLRDVYQVRTDAWILLDVAYAALLTPDDYMGKPLGTMFRDVLARNFDYLVAEKATGSAFARAAKVYPGVTVREGPWQIAYLLTAMHIAYTATGDADAKTAIEDMFQYLDGIRANNGLKAVSSFYNAIPGGRKNLASWDQLTFSNTLQSFTYSASTDVVSVVLESGWGALANGAPLMFYGDLGVTPPGGISVDTTYYMRDVSGSTFRVCATPGGPAIDLTTSGAEGQHIWAARLPGISNTVLDEAIYEQGIGTKLVASMRWAKALGLVVPAGLDAAFETAYGAGPAFTTTPIYALSRSFV